MKWHGIRLFMCCFESSADCREWSCKKCQFEGNPFRFQDRMSFDQFEGINLTLCFTNADELNVIDQFYDVRQTQEFSTITWLMIPLLLGSVY